MSNAVTVQTERKPIWAVLADRYEMEAEQFRNTIAQTCMPAQSTQEEFVAFLMVCNTYTLNPVLREIYAFPKKGGGIVPIVSIDGWIRLVNQHPKFKGAEWEAHLDEQGRLTAYTCRMHRTDREMPTVVTEFLDECIRGTEPWKMKNRMLRHKAFIQCARYAFGFSGIYDEDEGRSISEIADAALPARTSSTPLPPGQGKPVIEDADVREVKAAPAAEPKPEPEQESPAEEKGKPSRRQRGYTKLFAEARLVIEDGVFTKDLEDNDNVGEKAGEADYEAADLVLVDNVITKNVVGKTPEAQAQQQDQQQTGPTEAEIAERGKALADKVAPMFEAADSMDSLLAAMRANQAEYDDLRKFGGHIPVNRLYNAAKERIEKADAEAAEQERQQAAQQQEEKGGEVDDSFPGDRPPKSAAAADAGQASGEPTVDPDDLRPRNGVDPQSADKAFRALMVMSVAQYRTYCEGWIAAEPDPDAVKKRFFSEDVVRTYIGMQDADRKALRRLKDDRIADLKGE